MSEIKPLAATIVKLIILDNIDFDSQTLLDDLK